MSNPTKVNTFPYDYTSKGTASQATFKQYAASVPGTATNFDSLNNTIQVSDGTSFTSTLTAFEYSYSFARDGGASGAIALKGPALPVGFRIMQGYWTPRTAITSGGSAQISIGTSSSATTNLLAAAVLGTNGTVGPKATVPVFATPANSVRVTAESQPVMNVTVDTLTGGEAKLVLIGFMDVADNG
jgi:hypothetical protein